MATCIVAFPGLLVLVAQKDHRATFFKGGPQLRGLISYAIYVASIGCHLHASRWFPPCPRIQRFDLINRSMSLPMIRCLGPVVLQRWGTGQGRLVVNLLSNVTA